ncbi:MAG: TetR/AcrR family transcriptional regulator [Chloroflexia bacterium]|nr:TetR/AcrR family transcriptional regulator [Chloroflexia bacterium]
MSKSATRRESNVEDTRALILEAARDAFVISGYEGASIREVARRAGISHGTIYLHFRDKDDLLYQVSEHEYGRLLGRLRALPRTRDPIQRLGDALREVGKYGLEFPHQYELMMGHRPASFLGSDAPRFGPRADEVGSFIGDLVREAQKRSFLSPAVGDLDELALIAGMHGVVTMFALHLIDRATADSAVDHTISLLLSALSGGSCDINLSPANGVDSGMSRE